jgi:thiamine biosynthesis lipoprotein
MSPELTCHSLAAMGVTIDVQICGRVGDIALTIQRVFGDHEAALSRAREGTDLRSLNAATAMPFHASPLLFDAVSESLAWACVTDGLFDPTVSLARTDAPPRHAARHSGGVAVLARPTAAPGRWRSVLLDFEREMITVPVDTAIDLDGFDRVYTIDHAIAAIGPGANALVSASGDLYAAGDGPDGSGWYVAVQDAPASGGNVCSLNVNDRGVATARAETHAVETDLAAVTVIALTATQAGVLSRAALLLGSEAGLRLIERFDTAECVAITRHGEMLTTRGLPEYLT